MGPGYAWREQNGRHALHLHGVALVEIYAVRNAWIVEVRIQGPDIELQRVAVSSLERAQGWTTTWVRHRHVALERVVDQTLAATLSDKLPP